jgi:hypothetical protein
MDITIDGFHSWMWKGLGFLLPFLYIGYFLDLYNAYVLYQLSYHPTATWPVPALAVVFLVLGIGNITTTSGTILTKFREKRNQLRYRFTRLDKYFWSHKRRRNSVSQTNKKFSEDVERILSRSASYTAVNKSPVSSREKESGMEDVEENSSQTSDEIDIQEIEEVALAEDVVANSELPKSDDKKDV